MQFTKLRLIGFKSFVEPMEFVIERGLTGVVGPNGCGKSNLVEALRWVMGENSYKNMRASGMEDVIFSGSNTRPARTSAEVILYLDNQAHDAPPAFNEWDELQVSRRIEQGKGSTYRINDREVRAKDVQLLFADQSTGARSPSMVGQGRIGELIAAKPQARRALLEEAAGISGLYSRRHEAELRLKAAEGNLEQLDSITQELTSRIDTLKRQVRQASRFKALSSEIRKTEAAIFYLQWVEAKETQTAGEQALSQATLLVAEKAQAQMHASREQAAGQATLPTLRDEAMAATVAHQRLNLAAKTLDEEEKRATQRRHELMRRLEQLARDMSREEALMAENKTMLHRLEQEEEELKHQAEGAAEQEEEMREALALLTQDISEKEAHLNSLTAERAATQAHFEQQRRLVENLRQREEKLRFELQEAQKTQENLDSTIKALADKEQATHQLEEQQEKLVAWEEELEELEQTVQEAREKWQEAQAKTAHLTTHLTALRAEAQAIQNMLAATSQGDYVSVIENMEVEKGFEAALGSALGEALDGALDETAPMFWQSFVMSLGDPPLPSEVTPLEHYVKAPTALTRALAQIGLVPDDMDAQTIADMQLHLKTGQSLVNKEGALWRWDGLTVAADAPSASVQRLAHKNRLTELENLLGEATDELVGAEKEQAQAHEYWLLCENTERQKRISLKQLREACDKLRLDLAKIEQNLHEATSRHALLAEQVKKLEQDIAEIGAQIEEATHILQNAPQHTQLDDDIMQASEILKKRRQEEQKLRGRQEAYHHEVMQRLRRFEAIGLERKNWQARIDNAKRQMADLRDRQEEARDEFETGESDDTQDFATRRQSLLQAIEAAENAMKERGDRLAEAEKAQQTLDKQAAQALEQLSHVREARARAEERLHSAVERCRDIEGRINQALNIAPHELLGLSGLDINTPLPKIETMEAALERAKMERERLGAVNLRAEEEVAEMDARLQAMVSERDDVVEAIKKLRQAIHDLNREGRSRLLAAFDIVNGQFQRLFTHLFGGGTAQLQLIESDDPLEAGLEILARPPGKKPQTMTLLSGGEQALTATALIFAVFLTNPAPICVLDEVDAPLDDHNVERYCNLLDEMASLTQTRFIVITHNPITMARMNRLFGVTMGEQGVSQLVSVDLQAAARMIDTA